MTNPRQADLPVPKVTTKCFSDPLSPLRFSAKLNMSEWTNLKRGESNRRFVFFSTKRSKIHGMSLQESFHIYAEKDFWFVTRIRKMTSRPPGTGLMRDFCLCFANLCVWTCGYGSKNILAKCIAQKKSDATFVVKTGCLSFWAIPFLESREFAVTLVAGVLRVLLNQC